MFFARDIESVVRRVNIIVYASGFEYGIHFKSDHTCPCPRSQSCVCRSYCALCITCSYVPSYQSDRAVARSSTISSMLPSFPLLRPWFGSECSSAAIRCLVFHALCYLVAVGVAMTTCCSWRVVNPKSFVCHVCVFRLTFRNPCGRCTIMFVG